MKRRTFLQLTAVGTMVSVLGCSRDAETAPLRIAVNAWIGYAPLVYAQRMGWLKPLNIRLFETVSLGESLSLFESGSVDAFSATEYEFRLALETEPTLKPVILLDRSKGGDGIVANRTLEQLRQETAPIETYLEADSVNMELFQQFIATRKLEHLPWKLINQDQASNTLLSPQRPASTVVVTYSPYKETLLDKGFSLLADTRSLDLLIIDGIFAPQAVIDSEAARWKQLKHAVDRAIDMAQRDPGLFLQATGQFLGIKTASQLQAALDGIEWINHPSDALLEQLQGLQIPVDRVLR